MAITIVSAYLLLVGIILFIICLVGGKKNNLPPDYDHYYGEVSTHMSDADEKAAQKAILEAEKKDDAK